MSKKKTAKGREFTRVPFSIRAKFKVGTSEVEISKTRDISLKGIFFELVGVSPPPVGTGCEVLLTLLGMEPPIEIHLLGRIQRLEETGCAVEFQQIPLESYDHLQKLVRFNSQNPNQFDEEMKGHLGLHRR